MFLKISYLTSASQILKTPGENLTATLITYFNFLSHFSKLSSTLLDRMTTHAFYFFISNFLRCTLHNSRLSSNVYLADPGEHYSCAACFWRHTSCSSYLEVGVILCGFQNIFVPQLFPNSLFL